MKQGCKFFVWKCRALLGCNRLSQGFYLDCRERQVSMPRFVCKLVWWSDVMHSYVCCCKIYSCHGELANGVNWCAICIVSMFVMNVMCMLWLNMHCLCWIYGCMLILNAGLVCAIWLQGLVNSRHGQMRPTKAWPKGCKMGFLALEATWWWKFMECMQA